MTRMPLLTCRKCGCVNPFAYFAPVPTAPGVGICVCEECARKAGFLTPEGTLKPGYSL